MFEHCIALLEERGVTIKDINECVMYLQKDHQTGVTEQQLTETVNSIIQKREVQHAIMTGIAFDIAAEKQILDDKLLEDIINRDESLYGIDEVLAYGICNLYGSIALTNFGYIDKDKFGIIKKLNDHKDNPGRCNTFLDDIVGAIAASAASRIAHNQNEVVKEDAQ